MKCITSIVMICLAGMVLVGCSQTSTESLSITAASAPKPANRVVVHYLHRTFNCTSCLWIENTTRQTLKDTFPSELASGRLDFLVEEYGMRQDWAKRYDGQTASVLLVNMSDGREVSYQDLDRVWELKGENEKFRAYITETVRVALEKTK